MYDKNRLNESTPILYVDCRMLKLAFSKLPGFVREIQPSMVEVILETKQQHLEREAISKIYTCIISIG